jgi:hypothetical protein
MFFSVILNVLVFALQHDIRRFDISTHAHVHVHVNVNVHVLVLCHVRDHVCDRVHVCDCVHVSFCENRNIFTLKFFVKALNPFSLTFLFTENVC